VAEAAQHDLVLAYPVRFDKPGSTVARLKCTMLLLPTGMHALLQRAALCPIHNAGCTCAISVTQVPCG
jgi:hypothetical protein